jgi:ketosteroid isomerase-like protein
MTDDVGGLAIKYHEAWVSLDPDVIAALHSEDSVFHMHGVSEPVVGPAAIAEYITSFLRLVPDVHFEMKRFYTGPDHIAFEYDMSGTYSGTRFVTDGADVIAVANGLVTRKDTYFDAIALMAQIGPLPQIGVSV